MTREGQGRARFERTKIGDFYAAAWTRPPSTPPNKTTRAGTGADSRINNLADLEAEAELLHRKGVGALFRFSSNQDAKDSTRVIGAQFKAAWGCRSANTT